MNMLYIILYICYIYIHIHNIDRQIDRLDQIRLDRLDWIRLDQIRLDYWRLDYCRLDQIDRQIDR